MHPRQTFPANQDQSPRWESSLPDISCESGSIFPLEIIPPRHFLQIRINFPTGNHPCKSFSSNQDQFTRRKSSLPDISCESGSIFPPEIIPPRYFLQIRINFPDENHPCKSFSSSQDQFTRWKSSLPDIFIKSGYFPRRKCIPSRAFRQIRIIP